VDDEDGEGFHGGLSAVGKAMYADGRLHVEEKSPLSLYLMVNVIVLLEVDPQQIDSFISLALENAAASRQEPGCLRFEVSRDASQANLFALSESYRDPAAMEAHYMTPHVAIWRENAPKFVLKRWAAKGEVLS
jgi:autoinducer 2-degrading protein